MRNQLTATTTPTALPLTISDAKRHLGVTDTTHDLDIAAAIRAARNFIENRTGLVLITTSYELKLEGFPDEIEIPKAPLSAVNSLDYYDVDGVLTNVPTFQTWTTTGTTALLTPDPSTVWPATQSDRRDAVVVSFDAGYGASDDDVPDEAKYAIRLLVRHWYDNPSAVITGTISKEVELSFESLVRSLWTGFYADL